MLVFGMQPNLIDLSNNVCSGDKVPCFISLFLAPYNTKEINSSEVV